MKRFNIITCLVQALIGSPGIPSHKKSGLLFKLLDLSSCMTGIFHLGTLLSSIIRLCSTFLKSLIVKTTIFFDKISRVEWQKVVAKGHYDINLVHFFCLFSINL